jgi:hypothetical protein
MKSGSALAPGIGLSSVDALGKVTEMNSAKDILDYFAQNSIQFHVNMEVQICMFKVGLVQSCVVRLYTRHSGRHGGEADGDNCMRITSYTNTLGYPMIGQMLSQAPVTSYEL